MNKQRLRPLGLGDIFDEGFDLYKRNFVFLLLVTALSVVPLDILLAWISPRVLPPIFDLFGVTAARSDQFWVWLVAGIAKLTLFLPLYALALSPLVLATSNRYLEEESTLWGAYRQTLRRFPSLLLTVLVGGLALDLGFLGCGVGWLAVACQLLFSLHAVQVERKPFTKVLARSAALTGGYGGRVFNCLIVLGLISVIIGLGLRLPIAYLCDSVLNITPGAASLTGGAPAGTPSAEQGVVSLISSGLAHLLLIPFLVSVVTVLYFDLRIRKEGFDVEMLAQELKYPALTTLGPFLPPSPTFGVGVPRYTPPPQYQRYGGPPQGGLPR